MEYDVIVIGAGISGLSAASLLAKRGLRVAVVEHAQTPGGSCGIFKRADAVFDQGAAMLYGFGKHGFNAHRFLFNCLEEPIHVVKHELLYVVNYQGKQIRFWPDIDQFTEELSQAFPEDRKNIKRFYRKMKKLYTNVISENPSYTTPDEVAPQDALQSVLKHPISYLKFLSYLNISAERLLKRYFGNSEILHFFDKLTSTYCYATLAEAPAILASVMFIDNHEGGSYYPAGSTLFLPGKLEKVIEENRGEMLYENTVTKILFEQEKPRGVLLQSGETLSAKKIIYSGTVWSLYDTLLADAPIPPGKKQWADDQSPTYPSVVLYALVESSAIPPGTCPIEMLADNPNSIDESEITVYLLSIDDHTLCPPEFHTVIAIGPSFHQWNWMNPTLYRQQKQEEIRRIILRLDERFPGFEKKVTYCELATPQTIERYALKNGGAVAGPKQMLGQHLFCRQHIRTVWDSLFCCGESTVMGTGTPTVTVSAIAAANAVLKQFGKQPYRWKADMKNYVQVLRPPVESGWLSDCYPAKEAEIMTLAGRCYYCTRPSCCNRSILDVPAMMRRTACGNFAGAKNVVQHNSQPLTKEFVAMCEKNCIQASLSQGNVAIGRVLNYLNEK